MRRFLPTLVLVTSAAVVGWLATWQWREGSFDALFGAPPVAVGDALYSSFDPSAVRHITVASTSASAKFSLQENGWYSTAPWQDRMDPRAAVSIINFTRGMRVEDHASRDDIPEDKAGLSNEAVTILLEDSNRKVLAHYKMGRITPWNATVRDIPEPVPTVFISPREKSRKKHVYSCTGDINSLFKDNLRFLRDHRPFYFNPLKLKSVSIGSKQGQLLIARESPDTPWRIVKPLDLPTNQAAIKSLLKGLFELQAIKVNDIAAGKKPNAADDNESTRIAIQSFEADVPCELEIRPLDSADGNETTAIVSNRPGVEFLMPAKPVAGLITLSDLPLSVNELRDPTLTHLNIAALRGISIEPSTGTAILITREPSKPWTTVIDGVTRDANELNLYNLLKAVTTSKALAFESDAATDFTPWGLDRPILKLRFIAQDNQAFELRFGIDSKGVFYANRLGTPTVMRIDDALIRSVAVRPYEWRHERLWSVDKVNLLAIRRDVTGSPALMLKYRFIDEAWSGESDGRDVSATVDPVKANYFLSVLEDLKVSRWLAPNDESAINALRKPSLIIDVVEKKFDDMGEFAGTGSRKLILAPIDSSPKPSAYFGRMGAEANLFTIDAETYGKLAATVTAD
jgi:hypothetical protein